jgi:hypothetical protein
MVRSESDSRNKSTLTLSRLMQMMASLGVKRVYVKQLAQNDNSKNQPYFGSDFESLNILPNQGVRLETTDTKQIFKAALNFYWLGDDGLLSRAPGAQLILYPQYPEVRFSGFLHKCKEAPSHLMSGRQRGRLLFLGVGRDTRIIGHVVSAESPIAREFEELVGGLARVGVFFELPFAAAADTRSSLLAELRRIHLLGWLDSRRLLASGGFGPCESSNCGGYTLEAELGVLPNAFSEPDFLGWEIKQYAVPKFEQTSAGVLTLMTPEPSGGYYLKHGVEKFVRKFGYKDKLGRTDRMNFGGIHRIGLRHPATKLTLTLIGLDSASAKITDPTGGIELRSDNGESAATWRYADLMSHWNRKHARAAFIPSLRRLAPRRQYSFSPTVRLGEGTDFLLFLKALALGLIYYDPGIKLEEASTAKPKTKRRSQFRIRSGNLSGLYHALNPVSLL